MTFIFYDTETTGLSAGFDQILQFAAIITDDDLNPVEEVNLRCRLLPHVIASPGALAITGVRPADIAGANLSHYEMIRDIRALVERHAPVVMVGYNSISYDENMLRQAFYQTLNPIYLTNTGGNTRMDVLNLAHAASEYAPGLLSIPTNARGRSVFKLDQLAPANGLMHEDAHEAMSDTQATLDLARMIRNGAPEVWEALYAARSKPSALAFMEREEVFCATNMRFGQSSILATRIGANPENPSEVAVFDLTHDPAHYLDIARGDMPSLLRTTPRPIRTVKANQQPILVPYGLSNDHVAGNDLPEDLLRERAAQVRAHPNFEEKVVHAVANRYPPWEQSPHVEARIYEGFPSRADENLMVDFHRRPWEERIAIVDQFQDERLRALGERLVWAERPDVLSEEASQRLDAWQRNRFLAGGDTPWLTIGRAFDELAELRTTGRGDADLLGEVEGYLRQLSTEFS